MDIPWQKIVRFGQRTMLDMDLFAVSWILGRFCNYNCSYCWPYARTDTPDYQPLASYFRTVDEIKKQANANGFTKFHWSLSGGEPTAFKHLPELVQHIGVADGYNSLHMTSNISPGVKWWNNWLTNTSSFSRRSITASYHSEFANEQEFADKCLMLTESGVFVTVNQVMVPELFDELYERCDRFYRQGINVTLKPQSNSTASAVVDGYNGRMIDLMQHGFPQTVNEQELYQVQLFDADGVAYYIDQAERFNAHGFNKFGGWSCNSGYQSVIIRLNEVKRSYSCRDESLGTMTDGFRLFDAPRACSTPACVSSADSKIPKCK
jgi:hypothetical protein